MNKKQKTMWIYIGLFILAVFALSQMGVMNNLFAVTNVPCTSSAQCPEPSCVGSFTLADKEAADCAALNNTADKSACELSNWWYNAQNELATTQCVDSNVMELNERGGQTGWHTPIAGTGASSGMCEISPYCIPSDDIKTWLDNNPFAWIRSNFGITVVFALVALVIGYLLLSKDI
jgi:hypothetical protein